MTEQPTPPPADADPDDWAPCQGHPPQATVGFVGCSDHWPLPATDDPPGDDTARLAEASAARGTPDAAAAPAPSAASPKPKPAQDPCTPPAHHVRHVRHAPGVGEHGAHGGAHGVEGAS
jgi:hypothetical protein